MASARAPPVVEFDDQADAMAALDLALRDIHHMPEQPAERRAQNMHDLEAGRRERGCAVARGARRHSPARAAEAHAAERRMIGRGSPMRGSLNLTPK